MDRVIGSRLIFNRPRENWAFALGSWIVYIAAFGPVFGAAHAMVTAWSVLPLIVTGLALGTRVGLMAGLLNILLNVFLLGLVGVNGWQDTLEKWPAAIMAVALAGAFGWIGEVINRLRDQSRALEREQTALRHEVGERQKVEQALRQAHDELDLRVRERTAELSQAQVRYRITSELISDFACAVRIEPDGREIIEWSMGGLDRIAGYRHDELDDWQTIVHPDDMGLVRQFFLAARTIRESSCEFRVVAKNGETRWLLARGRSEWDPTETRVVRCYVAIQDATARRLAEEALRTSETKSLALVNAIPDMMVRMNRAGVVLDFKAGKEFRVETPPAALIGRSMDELQARGEKFPEGAAWQLLKSVRAALETGQGQDFESEVTWGGVQHHYETRVVISGKDEALGIVRDITARKHAEAEMERLLDQLRASRARLVALSQRLVEIQELERRQIARELHDQVGQGLTGLSINLNIIRSQLPAEVLPRVEGRLADSLKLVDSTVQQIRDVMAELRPAVLDDYGLEAALRWLAKRFAEQVGISTQFQGSDILPRLPSERETALFRISQEALNNIAKHAQAKHATLKLEELDGLVRLTIMDDGIGFDTTAPRQSATRMSWGLSLMRERARGVGGELYIHSRPSHGTEIIIEVPR